MSRPVILLLVIIVSAALVGSAYLFVFGGFKNEGQINPGTDTTPPQISSVTGNTTTGSGSTVIIEAEFSDNVNVTEATLFYKKKSETTWRNTSIVEGTADLQIPSGLAEDWYYYLTVDDAAGNGPVGDPSVDGSRYYVISVTQGNVTIRHTVLVEEGTATWCTNCPVVADLLHELENESELDFHYVSLIADKNTDAEKRVSTDYNMYGPPTVFIDGGYRVLMGSVETTKASLTSAINEAAAREGPALDLALTASYDNESGQVSVTVDVTNYDAATYEGTLRVYLVERISVAYYGGTGYYHNGFLKYLANEAMSVAASSLYTKELSLSSQGLDVENLKVIAAVFNKESEEQMANPTDNSNPFDAYYVDACNGTFIVEGGNLPPSVGITTPNDTGLYFGGFGPFFKRGRIIKNPILLFSPTIRVNAEDDSAIAKVEFYLDEELVYNCTASPFVWKWKQFMVNPFKMHNITVVAWDDSGKNASASISVRAFL